MARTWERVTDVAEYLRDEEDVFDARELIEALRGGQPSTCDACGQAASWLEPEEGGEWWCTWCVLAADAAEREEP